MIEIAVTENQRHWNNRVKTISSGKEETSGKRAKIHTLPPRKWAKKPNIILDN